MMTASMWRRYCLCVYELLKNVLCIFRHFFLLRVMFDPSIALLPWSRQVVSRHPFYRGASPSSGELASSPTRHACQQYFLSCDERSTLQLTALTVTIPDKPCGCVILSTVSAGSGRAYSHISRCWPIWMWR